MNGCKAWFLAGIVAACGPAPEDLVERHSDLDTADLGELVPESPRIRIEPEAPTAFVDLDVVVIDPQPDLTYEARWEEELGSSDVEGTRLSKAQTTKGQRWTVTVSALRDDGARSLPTQASVTIENEPPTVWVELPESGTAYEPIEATAGAEDRDGDEITLTFRWHSDTDSSFAGSAVLDDAHTERGETWTVTVTADDGSDPVTAEASLTLERTRDCQPDALFPADAPPSTGNYEDCPAYDRPGRLAWLPEPSCTNETGWTYEIQTEGGFDRIELVAQDSGGFSDPSWWWGESHTLTRSASEPGGWWQEWQRTLPITSRFREQAPDENSFLTCEKLRDAIIWGLRGLDTRGSVVDCVVVIPPGARGMRKEAFADTYPEFDGCREADWRR